ncbi:MAG: ribosome biogenesis GTPase Der [Anaerolineaceae bacterium]|nr:ribosome biogenesis GTPase Der [Anaerolineaceae bacterium]
MSKPVVALVGRPNVGKSTLFNRLSGEKLAIVDEVPGTTRDRLYTLTEWTGKEFYIVDTGGLDPTAHSSRSVLSIGSAEFIEDIRSQVEIAITEADVICFLVDVHAGVTPADIEVANLLRTSQKKVGGKLFPPILLVVNKADNINMMAEAYQFYELGMGDPFPISAMQGKATGDLLDAIVESFPPSIEEPEDNSVKIAIVGRPNVGKSTLLNKIVGKERSIVSPIPGTTRDAVDTPIKFNGLPITLIDTAGIRRRGRIERGVEKYSVIRSLRAIERADVALLLIDATTGVLAQDAHVAGFILEEWKSVIVVVNKWDAIEKDSYTMLEHTEKIRSELNFLSYVPLLFISAKMGQRVHQVLPTALQVEEERHNWIGTGHLNRIIRKAVDAHPPRSGTGRPLNIYYANQVREDPPTFMLHVNEPKLAHFSYLRYMENQIRREYPYLGTPIRIILKAS